VDAGGAHAAHCPGQHAGTIGFERHCKICGEMRHDSSSCTTSKSLFNDLPDAIPDKRPACPSRTPEPPPVSRSRTEMPRPCSVLQFNGAYATARPFGDQKFHES